MTTWIAFLPGILSLIAALLRSPERAFLGVYIPVLILLPQIFRADFAGIPPITFHKAAIIPIFLLSFFSLLSRWRFSIADFLILGYMGSCVYSEEVNSGLKDAINLTADMLASVLAPYVLAKIFISPKNNTVPLARRIVFLVFVVVILSVYEMRMTLNPFVALLINFFPGQGWDWPTLYRYGFVRIGGPFVQPILFGIMISTAILLNLWTAKNKFWKKNFSHMPALFIKKSTIISCVLLFGLIMTFSRAPWISSLLGFLLSGVGFSSHRWSSFFFRFLGVCGILGVAWLLWGAYAGMDQYLARSESAATAAYRGRMIREYIDIAMVKPWIGWGVNLWPKIPGMKSIDNQYLWLLLKHGFIAVGMFMMILLWMSVRLFKRGMRASTADKADSSLAFTFLGIYVSLGVSLATVYMGMQIEPLFFLITGWAEGYLKEPSRDYSPFQYPAKPQREGVQYA